MGTYIRVLNIVQCRNEILFNFEDELLLLQIGLDMFATASTGVLLSSAVVRSCLGTPVQVKFPWETSDEVSCMQ